MKTVSDKRVYHIGTDYEIQPADKRSKNVFYLVAYDICNPARLRRVAKTCEDYGVRVEKSVFECDLTEELFEEFWQLLQEKSDASEDSLLAYRIGGCCRPKALSLGVIQRPRKRLYYIL